MRTTKIIVAIATVSLVAACSGTSGGTDDDGAGNYPDNNITFIVPFSAGGPTDTVTRMIAEPMAKELGGKIVVQNKEGAGGTVGAGEVARAKPDGYTVLMHHIGMSTAPALYKNLADLVTYVKANAGKVTLANAGIGAASHLCGLLFQHAAGVKLQEVPYQGTGPALTDLVGGQVDFMCDQTTNTTGQITANKVKAYAVTTPDRVKSLPDLPTTTELGMPQLQVSVWHGLYAPKGTPQAVVQKLSDALKKALANQSVIDQMAKLGTAPVQADDATPQAHRAHLDEQLKTWAKIIADAGVKAT